MKEECLNFNPSTSVMIHIWWEMLWRAFVWWLVVFVCCFICIFMLGALLIYGFNFEQQVAVDISTTIFYPVMVGAIFIAPLAIFKKMLGKVFGSYRLALIKVVQDASAAE